MSPFPKLSLTKTTSGGHDINCYDCGKDISNEETIYEDAYEIKYCSHCGEKITLKEQEEIEAFIEPWE